jgi:two-component system chemotaxis response regulator CheB
MNSTDAGSQHMYRLLIVDDSPFYRLRFAKLFARSEMLTVVGVASGGEEAIRLMANEAPDVVVLDIAMPGLDGFAVLRWARAECPVPIVVCSSRSDRETIFKALELGAVDFITKPDSVRDGFRGIEPLLIERVEAAARAHLPAAPATHPARARLPVTAPQRAEVIAVAASTGGPAAIQHLVRMLPQELTTPIVIVQHMPPGFTRLFAERLERLSHYSTVEAADGDVIRRRTIYVAPGGMQTRIQRRGNEYLLAVAPRQSSDVHAPSADLLFESISVAYGPAAVAVVLTGMGDDGSRGIHAIKDAGGYVVAETSDSALIYGMPRAAVATGRADAQLPLSSMPEAFLALAGQDE